MFTHHISSALLERDSFDGQTSGLAVDWLDSLGHSWDDSEWCVWCLRVHEVPALRTIANLKMS